MKDRFKTFWMDFAWSVSKMSRAKRLQVGAIIVKDDRIISIGYNGMPSGWTNDCEYETEEGLRTRPEVLHAERNSLDKVARSTESSEGAVMFVTHTPCIECAKSIYNCGISKVYIGQDYDARKGNGEEFLREAGIKIEKIA
jgi:dCMP deaminase